MMKIPYALYESWPLLVVLADGTIVHKPKKLGLRLDGSRLGKVYQEGDGYYYWQQPEGNIVSWSAEQLYLIADALDELNESWDAQVRAEKEKANG